MTKDGKNTLLLLVLGLALFATVVLFIFSLQPDQLRPEPIAPVVSPTPSPSEISEEISEDEPQPTLYEYIEVTHACGPYWTGEEGCVNVRSGPGTEFPVVIQLRTGVVLKVADKVEAEGRSWYKISFDEWLRYPERVTSDWFVAAEFVESFMDVGTLEVTPETATTTKLIIVDKSDQMLYAYDGVDLVMKEKVSTGLLATPTPRGQFRIYKKTPSRYMQGPLPGVSDQYYDLPGVPWNLFFTYEGAVIHGAYWHDKFGQVWSHGCVNLFPEIAKQLYNWAELGTPIFIRD